MSSEKGSALILALIVSMILMVFGLAVSLTSLSDFTMSMEFESHKRALHTAEAGLAEAQRSLRGRTITAALQETRQVPVFVAAGPDKVLTTINTPYATVLILCFGRCLDFAGCFNV